jgi:hypothetical protein
MRFKSGITFGVLGPAAGIGAFILALQLQVSAMPAMPAGIDSTSIDRTFKSDRLPVAPAAVRPSKVSEQPSLPEGCVDASRWDLETMYDNEIPGRCIG